MQASRPPRAGPGKSLDTAVYLPISADRSRNRAAREKLYRACVTRASSRAGNTPLIEQSLALHRELAGLLGYRGFRRIAFPARPPKRAAVDGLIAQLADAARTAGQQSTDACLPSPRNGFAEKHLSPWDISFWAERQREHLYDYDGTRRFFLFPRVLEGLFSLASRLLESSSLPTAGAVWHPDVAFSGSPMRTAPTNLFH